MASGATHFFTNRAAGKLALDTHRWLPRRQPRNCAERELRRSRSRARYLDGWAHPHSTVSDVEGELRDEKRMLEVLNQTGVALARELDLDRLVQTVTDAGVQLVGAAFGAFFYYSTEKSGERLVLYTLSGAPRQAFEHFPLPGKTALFGPTLDGVAIVRSDDILKDSRYGLSEPHRGMPEGHLPVRSYLAVPVTSSSGEVHGGLFFGHPAPAVFKESSERVIVGIAAQAAIAMDNARLLQAAKVSERRFRALIEHSADGVAVLDAEGTFLYFSPSATAIEGYDAENMIGTSCLDTTHPDDVPLRDEGLKKSVLSPGLAIPMTYRGRHKDGHWLWLEGTLTSLLLDPAIGGIVANFRDITARTRAEELQIRSQKMEALGTLAGGIAHDFNNILLAIVGNVRLAIDDLPGTHPVQENLSEISKASQRATDLVGRILAFSRQQEPKRELIALEPVIQEALTLLRSTLPAMIKVQSRFEPDLPTISADSTQIHQIMMNLVTNAAHAIGPAHGSIEVVVDAVSMTPDLAAAGRAPRESGYVRICVKDSGCGMEKATIQRIFDPFYTSKPAGQGTGLGLSVVDGIVKKHEGSISVHSQPGEGTTFLIYFPAASHRPLPQESAPSSAEPGGGQRVLYIDDDAALVSLTTRILTRLGYSVSGFATPATALELFRRAPQAFDVVVTDLSMPGMSGLELARELHQLRGDIPILMTSGYLRPEEWETARQHGVLDVILKPYGVGELGAALARVLGVGRGLRLAIT